MMTFEQSKNLKLIRDIIASWRNRNTNPAALYGAVLASWDAARSAEAPPEVKQWLVSQLTSSEKDDLNAAMKHVKQLVENP